MIDLMRRSERGEWIIAAEEVNLAFADDDSDWNELKELVVEETVKCLYYHKISPKLFDLSSCDDSSEFMPAVIKATSEFMKDDKLILKRFVRRNADDLARWHHFMVDYGRSGLLNFDGRGNPIDRTIKTWDWCR